MIGFDYTTATRPEHSTTDPRVYGLDRAKPGARSAKSESSSAGIFGW